MRPALIGRSHGLGSRQGCRLPGGASIRARSWFLISASFARIRFRPVLAFGIGLRLQPIAATITQPPAAAVALLEKPTRCLNPASPRIEKTNPNHRPIIQTP